MDMEVILDRQGELPSIPLDGCAALLWVKQLRKQADWSELSRIDLSIRREASVKKPCRFILRDDLCAIPRDVKVP
jgi:hypothetical protein